MSSGDFSPLARFGVRLRTYRQRSGWSQAELGRLVHVSGTLIAKMERAERRPQPDVTRRIDEGLGAGGELIRLAEEALRAPEFGSEQFLGRRGPLDPAWRPAIERLQRLAARYDEPDDGPTRPMGELAAAVYQTVTWRLNANYGVLALTLPELIPELTRSLLEGDERQRGQAAGQLAQAWRAADAIASKLGLFDLSSRLIHVLDWAAGQAGDDLLLAAVAYVRGETFFDNGQLGAGRLMLERAAGRVELVGQATETPARAQYGSLHMRAGLMAAKAGLREQALAHLAEARSVAGPIRDAVWLGTAFGPASARIHDASAAVELGAPDRAIDIALGWAPPLTLPAERRCHFAIDLARAHLAVGDPEASLAALQNAFTIAPENVRVHPLVGPMISEIELHWPASASGAAGFREVTALHGFFP